MANRPQTANPNPKTTDKIALITGGSRGLGRAGAISLAEAGTDVILTFRSARDAAEEVVAAVQDKGRKAAALRLDVGDSASFAVFARELEQVLKRHFDRGSFDYLLNNAGHGATAPFSETSAEQLDELYRVHLKGPFLLTQALLPLMANGGRILNVSSGLARFSIPGHAAYATMKGGIEVMTRYLAKELGERRITANTLAPGAIETDFGSGAVRDNKELNQMLGQQTALGRVGLPQDIGAVIALLLSDSAAWITAQRIEASGGMFL